MTISTYTAENEWYFTAIKSLVSPAISVDPKKGTVTYDGRIKSDESLVKPITPEELVHATVIGLLGSATYNYPLESIGHEIHFRHGSKGSNADEVDIVVYDRDNLPFALIEIKPPPLI